MNNVCAGFQKDIINCINYTDYIVNDIANWNLDRATRNFKVLTTHIDTLCKTCVENNEFLGELGIQLNMITLTGIIKDMLAAQQMDDYILLADLMKLNLRPLLTEGLQTTLQVHENELPSFFEINITALKKKQPELAEEILQYVNSELYLSDMKNYMIEDTLSGLFTLKYAVNDKLRYYYTNDDPYIQLQNWLEHVVELDKREYHLLGSAFAYPIVALHRVCNSDCVIHCYDTEIYLLVTALNSINLVKLIEDGTILFHYDPLLKLFVHANKNTEYQTLIYPPAMDVIQNKEVKKAINKFYIASLSAQQQLPILYTNFYKNISFQCENIDELKVLFASKKVYIIAAGPSLDKNIEGLRNIDHENCIILASGTVYRKMMRLGIKPDYVIISEANVRVIGQIRGLAEQSIPLLLLSTACTEFYRQYQGPKYMIYQQEFEPAEEKAKAENRQVYMTGGSVSTLALDVAIRLGAAEVVFLGLDLAFTDNKAHADDTSNQLVRDESELISIPSYNGGTVLADEKFLLYRGWFKRRFKMEDANRIRVINATEGGAYIEGMEYMTLDEAMKQ